MATEKRGKSATARKQTKKATKLSAEYQPPDIAAPSICLACAKHPSLKKFIEANGAKGNRCGICHRTDQIASDPTKFEALSNLVKSLVRFYYHEFAYNPHWGGHDHVASLLCEPNEIVEHEAAPGFPRTEEDSEELRVSLFEDASPDYVRGVGVYAGHDPVFGRMALDSIGGRRSPIYSRIEERLQSENYFEVEKEFKRYLSKFGPALSATIPAGSLFYRARIGITKTYTRCHEDNELETLHQPYLGNQIGAPPPGLATAGRLNRVGVSFLYLATDKPTAAAEVRPHPRHKLSIVGFTSKKTIRVADFGAIDIVDFSSSDEMLDVYHLGLTIGYEIGTPITPEDRQRYSLTQLLADILRQQGYEGIRFPSSVAPGANLCIFKPALFVVQPDTATVLEVAELKYRTKKLKHLVEPTNIDFPLNG
jgi:hypothetical protein